MKQSHYKCLYKKNCVMKDAYLATVVACKTVSHKKLIYT